MHKTAGAFLVLLLLIAAAPSFADSHTPATPMQPLTGILERIRQDVGYYEVKAARWRGDITSPVEDSILTPGFPAAAAPPAPVCNVKDFDFDVTNVLISLQTVAANTGTASAGLQIPLLGKEGSADAGLTRQVSRAETVVLTRHFTYDKEKLSQYQYSEDFRKLEAGHAKYRALKAANPVLPIADTLTELHMNLINSAAKLPCFEWTNGDGKPESSSITIEFLVQQSADSNIGFNFRIVSAKAGETVERNSVNTLIVSFAPHPTEEMKPQQFGQGPEPRHPTNP